MSISNMLDMVRKRPGMYLGSNSITALWHFIHGYQCAEREYDVCRKELIPLPFYYMYAYTAYRLKESHDLGWWYLILHSCDGDEEAALWKFYEIYDEFVRVKMKRYWKAVLSEDNIAWNNRMEHIHRERCVISEAGKSIVKEPIYKDPLAVYVIELTIPVYLLAVETANDIQFDLCVFESAKTAKGNQCIPEGAEVYFGPIDGWEEFKGSNISFDKKIVV